MHRRTVQCIEHGEQPACQVCGHLVRSLIHGELCGFVMSDDPGNPRPDAWCDECEAASTDGWTKELEEQAEITLICGRCYDEARKINGAWPFVESPERQLSECRRQLGTRPRKPSARDRRYLKTKRPFWAWFDELKVFFRHQTRIFEEGRVTWGCIVQANTGLFSPGSRNLPGDVVYVSEASRRFELIELSAVAEMLFSLKGTQQTDPLYKQVSDHLGDELNRAFGMAVPDLISGNLPCKISTMMFNRKHLPGGVLARAAFPILVKDTTPELIALVPSRYWPASLLQHWESPLIFR